MTKVIKMTESPQIAADVIILILLRENFMKTNTGIWIDGSKALVIQLKDGKELVREIPSGIENSVHHHYEGDKGTFMGTHHISNERKFEERKKHQVETFLHHVMDEIRNTDKVYVMGPSELKHHLKSKIMEDKQLSPKLAGFASADHMTLNECVARVKEFYK
jgi:hypothetical protein